MHNVIVLLASRWEPCLISDSDIQKVRDATDLVSVVSERVPDLKPRGSTEHWGCCPIHHEKTPSFKVDSAEQFWHCFGCGAGGDVFGFLMKLDGITFPEAVKRLAERANIEIEEDRNGSIPRSVKDKLRQVCKETADFYNMQLMRSKAEDARAAREYLSSRDLGGSVPKDWKLGFAPGRSSLVNHLRSLGIKDDDMVSANVAKRDGNVLKDRFFNRVMFPIDDVSGNPIAFGGRVIGKGEPKYLNSSETPIFHKSNTLFALDKAKAMMASTGEAIVCEGYTDVIAMHEAGLKNAVATLGTSLTKQHITLLSRHAGRRIVYLFDGDAAGQRATERALGFIDSTITPEAGKQKMEFLCLTLPDGMDPAEFIAAKGADAMREEIGKAEPLIAFGMRKRLESADLETMEGRVGALADAISILAPIKDSILAKEYAIDLAGKLNLKEEDALSALAASIPRRGSDAEPSGQAQGAPSRNIPKDELNRLRMELEFLGLIALNPSDSIEFLDVASKIKWHTRKHADVAKALLHAIAEKPNASVPDMLQAASKVDESAVDALSATQTPSDGAKVAMMYLANHLESGDLRIEISNLRQALEDDSLSEEDKNAIYANMIQKQGKLRSIE